MDRLFLDANVLFSAAHREGAGVAFLWSLDDAVLSTSSYAIEEAERNLSARHQTRRLKQLIQALHIVETTTVPDSVRKGITLPDKDWPILGGALAADSTHLITGDLKHFGRYFQKQIAGILILPPADYLRDTSRTF
ncbi:MAG: hypothetical protein LC667_14270 [Thioalkalivibrio sp.]|nr:hypothetical protein [Thioalkalivibrio sp.]